MLSLYSEKEERKLRVLLYSSPKSVRSWGLYLSLPRCLLSPIYFTCLHNAFYEAYKSQMGIISSSFMAVSLAGGEITETYFILLLATGCSAMN